MSQSHNQRQKAHDPRLRQRSPELQNLLAHCPEHLFSTDDDELAPVDAKPDPATAAEVKQTVVFKAA